MKKYIDEIKNGMEFGLSERQEAARYTRPSSIGEQNNKNFTTNSTPIESLDAFKAQILTFVVPYNDKWAAFNAMNNEDTDIQELLEAARDKLWGYFRKSDLYSSVELSIDDMSIQGAGALHISSDLKTDRLMIRHIPIHELSWFVNKNGVIDTVVNDFELTLQQAFVSYPVLMTIIQQIDDPLKKIKLTRIVKPVVADTDLAGFDLEVYYNDVVVYSKKLTYNPYIIFRWQPSGNDMYGTSPTRKALPQIKHLYRLSRAALSAAEYSANPMLWTEQEIRSDAQGLRPGDLLISKTPIKALDFNTNVGMLYQSMQSLESHIRQLYYVQTDTAEDLKGVTATASRILRDQFYAKISNSAQRLERSLVKPIVEKSIRCLFFNEMNIGLYISQDNKIFLGNTEIQIEITSGVKEAIDRREGEETMESIQRNQQLAQFDPRIAARFDTEQMAVDANKKFGTAAKYIRTNADAQKELATQLAAREVMGQAPEGATDQANELVNQLNQ